MMAKGESEFVKARGLFVTGTDTEVGKTVIAGGIARVLKDKGQEVGVFKPVASGCRSDRGGLVSHDAEFLAHCADSAETLDQICPVRFREPLAPEVAVQRGAEPIELEVIRTYYNRLAAGKEVMIVEGIGGLLVPLSQELLVADLAGQMDLPLLIVANPGLGTINHTLLSIEAARARGLRVAGIVINSYVADTASVAEETNPAAIERASGVKVLAIVPRDLQTNVARGLIGPGVMFALQQIDYEAIL